MMILLDFPSIVKKYSSYFKCCFSDEGFMYFQKAVSGFIVSENKTLEAINRLFVHHQRDQSSFNRFFNQQNFDIKKINASRLNMLQSNEHTCFKKDRSSKGVLSIDNSLLKHYGKKFDNIYYHYDYVYKCYRWSHDLVSLYYSDDQTDYPVFYDLWMPPDWEAVARFLMAKDYTINQKHWDNRNKTPQKWRNYIRARYRTGRQKHPEVVSVYKTKLHIADELMEQFCKTYPNLYFPIALDSGFTSAELCERIEKIHQRDYVGALREDQNMIDPLNGQLILLKDFVARLRAQHADEDHEFTFQKTSFIYKGEKQIRYTYFKNHRIKGFEKKQRLVISFLKKEATDRPDFTITNRLNWYPSGILRIRRHRWPVETYHQEGKAEGLEKYQVRNEKAIQTYIALVVVAFSMLKCSSHDQDLLSSIQQRLQTETGSTLPFLRRLMKAEGLMNMVEYIFTAFQQGNSIQQTFQPLAQKIAYK